MKSNPRAPHGPELDSGTLVWTRPEHSLCGGSGAANDGAAPAMILTAQRNL
jgi:hypothetical protein